MEYLKLLLAARPTVSDIGFIIIIAGAVGGFFAHLIPGDKFFELVMLAAGAFYGAYRPGSKADRAETPKPEGGK